MNTFVTKPLATNRQLRSAGARPGLSPSVLRASLLLGCAGSIVLSMSIVAVLGGPQDYLKSDSELALLPRGMAAIKAMIVMAAVGLLFWRFGHPIRRSEAIAYLVGTVVVAGATAQIRQLSSIVMAAAIFHVGGFTL